jgi:serine/threonine protein kinase
MKLCVQCNTHYKEEGAACPADGGKLVEVGSDPMLGRTVGDRYRILHIIGRGSMGIVYKGLQVSTGREMAIKFLLQTGSMQDPGEPIIKRFQREAKTLSSLKHPNIVTLFDFGFFDDNKPYLVTEFLHGLTLTQFLRQNGHLDPRKALPIFEQVCDAVSEAHQHKVVHRDIKPDNIFLQGKDQGGRFIKVLDFGIAKLLDTRATTSLTIDGRVCGSPAYMSPEQCKAIDVDFRCDIYSLAVVVFETLTGRRPFDGADAMSVMFAHVNESPPSLTSIRNEPLFTPELETVLQKALNKEPEKRQQSIQEFWDDFSNTILGTKKNNAVAGWIPFPSVKQRSSKMISEYQAELEIDLKRTNPSSNSKQTVYLHEFRRKQRQFFMRVGICIAAAIAGYMLLDDHSQKHKDRLEMAETLTANGRPEDAVKILEQMKQGHSLSPEYSERLNNAYLQSAIKYGKRKQYAQAVEMLKHVSSKSKCYDQASVLSRRYKKLASS